MDNALIGATGFVGRNLRLCRDFDQFYNSGNIASSAGQSFDTVVCAAAPGSMVEANRAPARDAARVDDLIAHLKRLQVRRFVLISSIAVLSDFGREQDEGTEAFEDEVAYGVNRRRLEAFCADRFETHLIVRLPALFGKSLKKNLLFDLMNPVPSMLTDARRDSIAAALPSDTGNRLFEFYAFDAASAMWHLDRDALDASGDRLRLAKAVEEAGFEALRFTNPQSEFQFFDLSTLSGVIDAALEADLRVLHAPPEPLSAQQVVTTLRGRPMQADGGRLHREDLHTRHAALFGRIGRYSMGADETLDRLRRFAGADA